MDSVTRFSTSNGIISDEKSCDFYSNKFRTFDNKFIPRRGIPNEILLSL